MRSLRVGTGVLLLGALLAGGYALAARSTVSLTASGPQPPTVTADWGDTVAFSNTDTVERSVVSTRAQMDSGPIPAGGTFEYRFVGRAGSYRYTQTGSRPNSFGFVVVTARGTVTLRAGRALVPYGSQLSLAGRSTYVGTPVLVEFRPAGATASWTKALEVTAGASGTYAGRIRMTAGGRLRAVVAAGQVRSEITSVSVVPRITMTVRRTASKGAVVSARVVPASAVPVLDLEQRETRRQGWGRVATKPVSKAGTVAFVLKPSPERRIVRIVARQGSLRAGFSSVATKPAVVPGA